MAANPPLTVNFTGICTHITSDTQHRVVLVHAEDGASINSAKIPPHVPLLRINPDDILNVDGWLYGLQPTPRDGMWIMRGVQLHLDGIVDAVYTHEPSYADVPRLKSLTPTAPLLSDDVVKNGQAACYFDITGGHLSASKTKHGAVSTVLSVATTDKPALGVRCFWNDTSRSISLRPGASIHIEHTGVTLGDSDLDFLLHYRVLTSIPPNAAVPPSTKTQDRDPGDITSGCSNSQYP